MAARAEWADLGMTSGIDRIFCRVKWPGELDADANWTGLAFDKPARRYHRPVRAVRPWGRKAFGHQVVTVCPGPGCGGIPFPGPPHP